MNRILQSVRTVKTPTIPLPDDDLIDPDCAAADRLVYDSNRYRTLRRWADQEQQRELTDRLTAMAFVLEG